MILKAKFPRTSVVFNERYVVDRNLVTSNGGLISYEAALVLLEHMTDPAFATKVGDELYFNRLAKRGRS